MSAKNDDELREYGRQRLEMVRTIEREAAVVADRLRDGPIGDRILEVMKAVPRHEFVPVLERFAAYFDGPLPIGRGQTISQPFIVAFMTEVLEVAEHDDVLEIGTGSGYQAAVLAELVRRVYTVEIIPDLAAKARERLRRLGYDNVEVREGDGHGGWPEHAPYAGIVVTAATPEIPPALVDQLAAGGRLVIPVGATYEIQWLTLVEKHADGRVEERPLFEVRFVPLTGAGRA